MQSEQIKAAMLGEFIEVDSEDEAIEKDSELPADIETSLAQTTNEGFYMTSGSLKRGGTQPSNEKNYQSQATK